MTFTREMAKCIVQRHDASVLAETGRLLTDEEAEALDNYAEGAPAAAQAPAAEPVAWRWHYHSDTIMWAYCSTHPGVYCTPKNGYYDLMPLYVSHPVGPDVARDAARYRYLRVNPVPCANIADHVTYTWNKGRPEYFDEAVDAALGQQAAPPGEPREA